MKKTANLPEIPYLDLRDGGPSILMKDPVHLERLKAWNDNTFGMRGPVVEWAFKTFLLDKANAQSRARLEKTEGKFLPEIDEAVRLSATPAIYSIVTSVESACTTGGFAQEDGTATFGRILDWPFPGLGKLAIVAHQQGPAGEFHNVTWSGYASVVVQAAAEGRFAASVNQAPKRRFSANPVSDFLRRRREMLAGDGRMSLFLLREAFETARNYAEAREMLADTPVAIPVIYTLVGTKAGEACVIERTEREAHVREMAGGVITTTNHFRTAFNEKGVRWQSSGVESETRAAAADCWTPGHLGQADFGWMAEPNLNKESRIAMVASPAHGTLELVGLEGTRRVTRPFRLGH